MTTPSSTPRGERAGRPGAQWGTVLRTTGEHVIPNDAPTPQANRAARRAARRRKK
ncbi:hypothetical protein OH809_45490 (plasmid) [Streptomyces sp. NBC_00873]|uniref:hypothetical protein n=1 Tax=Streptomyces sp. NBC_00873 TaxID=2975852 RepID=UPI00386E86B5|nr:hypothetical protein OH809_45490 [Streptomyces sp. NBC_00873]